MDKNYVMFISENIFKRKENQVIVGIVFEEEDCTSTDEKISEVEEKVKEFKNINTDEKDIINFLEKINFKIIISKSPEYSLCIKNLFKEFNFYLEKVNGTFGKVVFKDNKNLVSANKIQHFFDVFNEHCDNLYVTGKINSFVVCDNKKSIYKSAFEICDSIYGILDKMYCEEENYKILEEERLNFYEVLSDKYVDVNFLNELYEERKLDIKLLLSEIENLQYEVKVKNTNILNSKLTISKLKEEIEKLRKQMKLSDIFQNKNVNDEEYSEV